MTNTIQRAPKDKEHPYVMVARSLIYDPSISLKLKGFLVYCLSKKDGWKYNVINMCEELNVTDECIYKLIKEGMQQGYITRTETRSNGRYSNVNYFIHEDKNEINSTIPEKQDTVNPDPVTPEDNKEGTYSVPKGTSYEVKNENTNKSVAAFVGGSPLIPHGKYVKLSNEDYESLCKEHMKPLVDQIILEMNDYIPNMDRKPYKDHASAIRTWIRKRKSEPNSLNSSEQNKSYAVECSKKYSAIGATWDIQDIKVRIDGGGSITWCEEFRYDMKDFRGKLDRFLKDKKFRSL